MGNAAHPNAMGAISQPNCQSLVIYGVVQQQLHSFTMSFILFIRAAFISLDLNGSSKCSHMALSVLTLNFESPSCLVCSHIS